MLEILILEDSIVTRHALEAIIKLCSGDIQVFFASNLKQAEALLETQSFGLFFLDVNLEQENREDASGIQFAKLLRKIKKYEFTPIVFITSILELELMSYRETQCYKYITKPFSDNEIKEIVLKVMHSQKQTEHSQIIIKKEGINYNINTDEIAYIEAMPRGCIIHLRDEIIQVKYLTLKQIIDKLPEDMFIQSHRMFVVNVLYIDYIDNVNRLIKMKGSHGTVEIGVTYKSEMRRFIHEGTS